MGQVLNEFTECHESESKMRLHQKNFIFWPSACSKLLLTNLWPNTIREKKNALCSNVHILQKSTNQNKKILLSNY